MNANADTQPRIVPASGPTGGLRRTWVVVALLLAVIVFTEAVFAGAMLSGVGWARAAHGATAALLVVSTAAAGLTALVALRRTPQGRKLGAVLMALAALLLVQAVLGAMSAKGANLTWLHVPLGVALVGLAGQAVAIAGRLGRD